MRIVTEQHPSVHEAQAMYRRTLTGWVLDLSRLRRRGLDTPGARKARRFLGVPGMQLDDRTSQRDALRRAA